MLSSPAGYERAVQRTFVQLPASPDVYAYWTWNEQGTNFVLYGAEASVDIELAYQQGVPQVDLSSGTSQLPYTVNFTVLEQVRHHYGTRRKIERHSLSLPVQKLLGISGPPSVTPSSVTRPPVVKSGSGGTVKGLPSPASSAATKSGRSGVAFGGRPSSAGHSVSGVPVTTAPPAHIPHLVSRPSPPKRRRKVGKKGKAAPRASGKGGASSSTPGRLTVVLSPYKFVSHFLFVVEQSDSGIAAYAKKITTLKAEDDGVSLVGVGCVLVDDHKCIGCDIVVVDITVYADLALVCVGESLEYWDVISSGMCCLALLLACTLLHFNMYQL